MMFETERWQFPSPTGVDHYEWRAFKILIFVSHRFRPLQGLTIMNKTFDNLKHSFILFPSPTGVDHYEYKMIEAFECDMALGFRPLQGLTIMNKTFDNLKHSFILFPSPTGVDHYECKT